MSAVEAGGPSDRLRVPARRPRVVLIDVFETMLRVDALRSRFVDVGRPEHEWELFFTRTLRDGMALTLAGGVRPFAEVARAALRTTDRAPAVRGRARPRAGRLRASCRRTPTWSRRCRRWPRPGCRPTRSPTAPVRWPATRWTGPGCAPTCAACCPPRRSGRSSHRPGSTTGPASRWTAPADRVALVAAHSWDVHGAVRAGLVGALATRLEGAVPDVVTRPHVSAERLDEVVDAAAGAAGLTPTARTDPGHAGRRGRGLVWTGHARSPLVPPRPGFHPGGPRGVPLLRPARPGDLRRQGQEPAAAAQLLLRRPVEPAPAHPADGHHRRRTCSGRWSPPRSRRCSWSTTGSRSSTRGSTSATATTRPTRCSR